MDDITWETWSVGGEVDPKEADYDLDAWVYIEPIDREAAAAAEASGGGGESGAAAGADGAMETTRLGWRTGRPWVGAATMTVEAEAGGPCRAVEGRAPCGETRARAAGQFEWVWFERLRREAA